MSLPRITTASRWIGVFPLPCRSCRSPRSAADESKKNQATAGPAVKVSYDKQVRPIFQAHCQGCHQPAKAGGGYVMTAFDRMLKGGESGRRRSCPGKPDESHLIEQITPRRRQGRDAPGQAAAGRRRDRAHHASGSPRGPSTTRPRTPGTRYDMEHPPVYTPAAGDPGAGLLARRHAAGRRPGSTRSCSGRPTAPSWSAGWSGCPSGSSRSRFSPDGKRLAVTGGLPGADGRGPGLGRRQAEARRSRCPSPSTRSTARAGRPTARRSPSAAPTTRVRAIDAKTGEQVLFMGSHNDWVLDTVFSADGSHLISVGRDMAAKLTEVATQRFVDNITSITPGALKGGIAAVARHPKRDEIVDRRLRRHAQALPDLPPDGPRDRRRLEPDPRVPADAGPGLQRRRQPRRQADRRRQQPRRRRRGRRLLPTSSTPACPTTSRRSSRRSSTARSAEENAALEAYHKAGVKRDRQGQGAPGRRLRRRLPARRQGRSPRPAADGIVRLIDPETGTVVKEFAPAPLGRTTSVAPGRRRSPRSRPSRRRPVETETLPKGAALVGAGGPARRDPARPAGSPTPSSLVTGTARLRARRST